MEASMYFSGKYIWKKTKGVTYSILKTGHIDQEDNRRFHVNRHGVPPAPGEQTLVPRNSQELKPKHSPKVLFVWGQLQTLKSKTMQPCRQRAVSDSVGSRICWQSLDVQQRFSTISSFLSYFIIVCFPLSPALTGTVINTRYF